MKNIPSPSASYKFLVGSTLSMVSMAALVQALPTGGSTAAGTATIVDSAGRTDINQSSNKAIINWDTFNVANGEVVQFNQPDSSAVTLNRIHDANPSQILGQVNANGTLMLVNPNGLMIGSTGSVNVANLVVTTADIGDTDFMNGNYVFSTAGASGANITVNGSVIADAGYAAIVGPRVNVGSTGYIRASAGKVSLAGGDVFTLDPAGDHLVNFALPTGVTKSGPNGAEAHVEQAGQVFADAGTVELTAKAATTALDSVVNVSGIVQAHSAAVSNGKILITGDNISLATTGQLDAGGVTGDVTAHDGGTITASAAKVMDFAGKAKAIASDPLTANGGSIYIGGKTLHLLSGGSARTSTNTAGVSMGAAGTTTFYSKNTFNVTNAAASVLADSLVDGGRTYVKVDDNVVQNGAITGPVSFVQGELAFLDGDNDGVLTLQLHHRIKLQAGDATHPYDILTGQGTDVQMFNDPNASLGNNTNLQNAFDLASGGGATITIKDAGYYYGDAAVLPDCCNFVVNKPNITLKGPNSGIYGNGVRNPEAYIYNVDITANADGFTVDGLNTFAIHNLGADNVTIKNNIFGRSFVGITADGGNNLVIAHNQTDWLGAYAGPEHDVPVKGSTDTAIWLENTTNATVAYNTVNSYQIFGLELINAQNTLVNNNTFITPYGIDTNRDGMESSQITGLTLQNNNLSFAPQGANWPAGGFIGASLRNTPGAQLIGNNFSYYLNGMQILDSPNVQVTGGSIVEAPNSTNASYAASGVSLFGSTNVLVQTAMTNIYYQIELINGSSLDPASYSYVTYTY